MAMFNKGTNSNADTETPEQKKQREMKERIDRNMKVHGLDTIPGEENQNSLRCSIEKIIAVKEFMKYKKVTAADVELLNQQDVIIEQNFVIIRLLNEILKKL